MLFDTEMIMHLRIHCKHLHAWYSDPRYEHAPSLLLESSERMKFGYIYNYKVLDSTAGCEKILFYLGLKQTVFLGPEG